MAIKIAIANMKGGIGKTTTALCVVDVLKNKGYKVLLIDTDPQKSSSGVYDAKIEDTSTLADIMYNNVSAKDTIQTTKLGDIIASDSLLTNADTQIKADADRFYHLSDACAEIEDEYDFIICDCPPGNGVMLGNVLCYVDYVIMPITCDKFGVEGMTEFANVMSSYTKRINPKLKILGVVIIKYKGRQALTKNLENGIIPAYVEQLGTKLFETRIRECVKCQEAQTIGVDLSEYAKSSTIAKDYDALTEEILVEVKAHG